MSLRRPTVAFLLQALSVMSLRRPTVAFLYKPFMWCRLDARLRHEFCLFTFRGVTPDTRSVFSYLFYLSSRAKILSLDWAPLFFLMTHSCIHLLYPLFELSCEYFQSTPLACWFGQMLMKAISWMKSSIASPTPRGVPVSPVRSCIWSLYYIRFRHPRNKYIEPHLDARWTAS